MDGFRLLRLPAVQERFGAARSSIYEAISNGVFPGPIKIGPQSSAWPSHEVDAVIAARIAGRSADEIRELVRRLTEERKSLPERLASGRGGRTQ